MKNETCPTCGGSGVVEDDLAEFSAKIPEGCVCFEEGWWSFNMPEICGKYVHNEEDSSYGFLTACKTCEHDEACHKGAPHDIG